MLAIYLGGMLINGFVEQKVFPFMNACYFLFLDFYLARRYIINLCAAAAKSLQSCLTLCDPVDGSPPGSPVPGILQARPLEWVAISFSSS